jgi:RHS repeat-associated protein
MFYNTRGDLIRTLDADGKETLIEYDARFRKPTRIQNALNNVTTMVYDVKGNLTSLTNAENEATTFTYTAKGQLATVVDPLLRTTSFTYDADGNLLTSTNTAGEVVTRTYDGANRLFLLTDALNRVTEFTYDDLDRVKEVRDAIGGLTKYAFDANDNLTSATDARNNPVERNVYDLRNRLKTRTDAKNKNTTYVYDGVGNLTSMTDRKGQVTTYSYDALNRITQVSDQDGRTTSYTYDLAGNLARMTDSQSGEMLMSYDVLDRLTEVVTAQGTVQYGYDAIGRRTSRTLSGGDVTTYTYDKVNRLKTVTLRNRTATYNYDLAGRLTEKILPNGLKTTYQYDAADRVTSIAYTKPDNSVVESVAYSYDAGGQRIAKTEGQQAPADTTFSATYDESNRLTAITIAGEPFTLAYDDNGNLTTKTGPVAGTTTYGWSARNQLISLSSPAGSATFRYDAMGRRTEKTVNGQTTGFLYDGAQAIAELRGGSIDTVYHTGVAIDEVLARYGSSGNKTLLTDALMSVIAQANDSQGVDNFYAYSPYGEVAVLGPDGGNDLQYAALRNDGTGLYQATYRYYDPVLKQWISEDPIGLAGGINQRMYVGGNPISFTDPYGLDNPGMGAYGPAWNVNSRPWGANPGGTPGLGDNIPRGPLPPPFPPAEPLPPWVMQCTRFLGAAGLMLYPRELACSELPDRCLRRERPELFPRTVSSPRG